MLSTESLEAFKKLFLQMKNSLLQNAPGDAEWSKWTMPGTGPEKDELDQVEAEKNNLLYLKLKGRQTFYLRKIDEALDRVHNHTFGDCEECGVGIGEQRLRARPMTTHCIVCKEEMEREESHIIYNKKSHTHGTEILTDSKANPAIRDEETGEPMGGAVHRLYTQHFMKVINEQGA
jgi:DnaK suppressor protein